MPSSRLFYGLSFADNEAFCNKALYNERNFQISGPRWSVVEVPFASNQHKQPIQVIITISNKNEINCGRIKKCMLLTHSKETDFSA